MREYTPNYTEAFRDEVLAWFETRMDRLPQSMEIDPATKTDNLRRTVEVLSMTLKANAPSVIFSGYMETLLRIRDRLEEAGIQ